MTWEDNVLFSDSFVLINSSEEVINYILNSSEIIDSTITPNSKSVLMKLCVKDNTYFSGIYFVKHNGVIDNRTIDGYVVKKGNSIILNYKVLSNGVEYSICDVFDKCKRTTINLSNNKKVISLGLTDKLSDFKNEAVKALRKGNWL